MDRRSEVEKCISTQDWNDSNIRKISWRLNLVYCYKLRFDPAANFSQAQVAFINGFMSWEQVRAIASHYYSAIVDSLEKAQDAERAIRDKRLVALGSRDR